MRRSKAEELIVAATPEDRWLTAKEIAKRCGLSAQKVSLTVSFKCKDLIDRKRKSIRIRGKNKYRVMFVYRKRRPL